MTLHDELVNAFIEILPSVIHREEDELQDYEVEKQIFRGWIDVFAVCRNKNRIFEVKTIFRYVDVGALIRQVKRYRKKVNAVAYAIVPRQSGKYLELLEHEGIQVIFWFFARAYPRKFGFAFPKKEVAN